MTIERSDQPHWKSEPKVEVLEPGYAEVIHDSFGVVKVLRVEDPDSVTLIKTIDGFPTNRKFEGENINSGEIRWFRGLYALNLLIGKKVKFTWSPTPEPNQ